MLGSVGDGFAIFAPHANSYRRFKANSYAPVAPTWGVNNRTVSFRIPAGPPPSRHVEHRACGADANPYLAVAAVLRSEEHTSELHSLMRISYAVFCLKKKTYLTTGVPSVTAPHTTEIQSS